MSRAPETREATMTTSAGACTIWLQQYSSRYGTILIVDLATDWLVRAKSSPASPPTTGPGRGRARSLISRLCDEETKFRLAAAYGTLLPFVDLASN